ncbi:MAG: alpha/beta hydrolase [Pseudomonadota bacterium]|nr:alpha/beta hydrolase [Pseudomonadota bacterium]
MASHSKPDVPSYVRGGKVLQIGCTPKIAVEYIGEGPLILFLHGIGGDRSTWSHQLSHFAETGFCAAAWDARGYGDSDDYDGKLSFTDMAHDLANVLDAFSVFKAHIVGTSMGGRISLEFYANFPERFATLTLAGVHARFDAFSKEAQRNFVESRRKPLVEDGLEPSDLAPLVIGKLVGPDAPQDAITRGIASMSRLHKNSYLKTVQSTTSFNREHVLSEIAVPTLVIGGEFDPLTPLELTQGIAARIPQAVFHPMYNVGHLGNLENPQEFNRLTGQFLTRYRERANFAANPKILRS